jgi:ubiquinone/menaquinone biosynthesis C-methylase UbiE
MPLLGSHAHDRTGVKAAARRLTQRAIARIYSALASGVYDRVVVGQTLRMLGGDLVASVREQGRRAALIAAGSPVLDLPIGTGYFTLQWAEHHDGVVVGVDIAGGMVRRAAARAAESPAAGVVVLQADAHHLPFRSGCFGAIMCTNGLPVMPGPAAALAEMRRTLSPSGALLACAISVPLDEMLPRGAAAHLPALFRSQRGLEKAFEAGGLEVTSVQTSRLALLLESRPAGFRKNA